MLCHLHQLPDPCKATAAGQPRRSAMAGITCFWRGHNGGGDVIGFGHPNRSDSKIKGLIGSWRNNYELRIWWQVSVVVLKNHLNTDKMYLSGTNIYLLQGGFQNHSIWRAHKNHGNRESLKLNNQNNIKKSALHFQLPHKQVSYERWTYFRKSPNLKIAIMHLPNYWTVPWDIKLTVPASCHLQRQPVGWQFRLELVL